MRRSLLFLAPLSLCVFAVFACEDDNAGGGGTIDLDAGGLDVTVVPPTAIDGSTNDAEAAAPTGVSVAVGGSATARANVEIVFQYADGALETLRTAADGTATSTGATTPAMATALISGGNRFTPFTWTGLVAGDVLSVPAIDDTSAIGKFNVTTAAGSTGKESALHFEATSGCTFTQTFPAGSTFAPPYGLNVSPQCATENGKFTLLARESAGTTSTGFAFAKDLAAPSLAGTAETLAAWSAPPSTLALGVTNPSANGDFVTTQLAEVYDGATFNVQNAGLIGGQAGSASFRVATGFASAYQGSVTLSNGSSSQQQMLQQTVTTAMSFDLSLVLPVLSNGNVAGDPLAPDFTWDGDTAAATIGGAIQFTYEGTTPNAAYVWTILVPAGTNAVHLPKLPADAAAFAPISTSTIDGSYGKPEVLFVQATGITATKLRGKLSAFPGITQNGLLTATRYAPLPAPGLYRVTAFHDISQ